MPILPSNKNDELKYLLQMGWLVEGTAADAGKHKLTAKGIAEYTKLVNAMDTKLKVLVKLQAAGNAFADVKGLM